jgi:CxxC motif-containing protein
LHPAAPIKIGDVLLEKIDGEANLVATGNSKR